MSRLCGVDDVYIMCILMYDRILEHSNRMSEQQPPWRPPEHAVPGSDDDAPDTRGARLAGVLATLEQGIDRRPRRRGLRGLPTDARQVPRLLLRQHPPDHDPAPDATRVNSYKRWQELGRQVAQGRDRHQDLLPQETDGSRTPTPASRASRVTGFGVGNVFDV